LAGINYKANDGSEQFFRVDLDSGSAPGAGDYAIDIAMGDASSGHLENFNIYDNNDVLIDGTGGGSGISTNTGEYVDATLNTVAATTEWTGTPVVKTFSTTIFRLGIGGETLAGDVSVASFRLTFQEVPPTPVDVGSWITTEVGTYVRGITDQFGGGGNILEAWKAEAEAAAIAGPPYPYFQPVLKRLMLEYFISIQP